MTEPTTLYRLYNDNDRLLYVGIARNWARRAVQHSEQKSWWPEVARTALETHPTRDAALDAEREAIKTEHPIHNVKHNGKTDTSRRTTIKPTMGLPLREGQAVALRLSTCPSPPVGLITAIDDDFVQLDLYSWLTCAFGGPRRVYRISDVIEIEWADSFTATGGWEPDGCRYEKGITVFEMEALAAFQTRHDTRQVSA